MWKEIVTYSATCMLQCVLIHVARLPTLGMGRVMRLCENELSTAAIAMAKNEQTDDTSPHSFSTVCVLAAVKWLSCATTTRAAMVNWGKSETRRENIAGQPANGFHSEDLDNITHWGMHSRSSFVVPPCCPLHQLRRQYSSSMVATTMQICTRIKCEREEEIRHIEQQAQV